MEDLIPNDDPVRLLNVFVEGMELTDLYQTYGKIKKSQPAIAHNVNKYHHKNQSDKTGRHLFELKESAQKGGVSSYDPLIFYK